MMPTVQVAPERDRFLQFEELNKVPVLINVQENLLGKDLAHRVARGIYEVITDAGRQAPKYSNR